MLLPLSFLLALVLFALARHRAAVIRLRVRDRLAGPAPGRPGPLGPPPPLGPAFPAGRPRGR